MVDDKASNGQADSLDAWTLWTLILETEFQNMNNNIKLGALGFSFGTLNVFKANRTLSKQTEQDYYASAVGLNSLDASKTMIPCVSH